MCSSPNNNNSLNFASQMSVLSYNFMFCVKEGLVLSSGPVVDKTSLSGDVKLDSWFFSDLSSGCHLESVCKISYYFRMADAGEKNNSCGTICLKYLLFVFNLLFWVSLCFILIIISQNSSTIPDGKMTKTTINCFFFCFVF